MKTPVIIAALCAVSVARAAAPLALDYSISNDGSKYFYSFTLVDTQTPDPNVGFGWVIFGDVHYPGPSPLADFTLTSSIVVSGGTFRSDGGAPPNPWNSVGQSNGAHNGPDLAYVGCYWTPSVLGDTVTWSGTSASYMGSMQWSSIQDANFATGDVTSINFEQANLTPEPAPFAVLGLGAVALLRRRKSR